MKWKNFVTVLAEFRGSFTDFMKYFCGSTAFGTPYDRHITRIFEIHAKTKQHSQCMPVVQEPLIHHQKIVTGMQKHTITSLALVTFV